MSTSTPSARDRFAAPAWSALLAQFATILLRPVQFTAFWTAVVLPFVLFPMFMSGYASEQFLLFVALLATNVVALVVGRGYND